jgi:tRNA A-37 threonylcarbamoyl transferase component Bud32
MQEGGKEVEVCIKFVKRYSADTHKFCASEGFAPHVIGFIDLGGGWKMVVMERIDESFEMVRDMTWTVELGELVKLYDSVKEKLIGLHQRGYVHGDVRGVNVMARKENGGYSVRLLDFDCAGKIGEVRYPRDVGNRKG